MLLTLLKPLRSCVTVGWVGRQTLSPLKDALHLYYNKGAGALLIKTKRDSAPKE